MEDLLMSTIMEENIQLRIHQLIERYPQLEVCGPDIASAYNILKECFYHKGKLLVAGNGGSASDSEHIVGELMKEFKQKRKIFSNQETLLMSIDKERGKMLAENLQGALPAISLVGEPSLTTAFMNDAVPLLVFAQQVNGYGFPGDVFWGISTSGNSENILYAAVTAKSKRMKVIGLTGSKPNKLEHYTDVCIHVPEEETYKIQELHIPVYHCLCLMLEDYFFGGR
jgi:D-sedoheptulose 7-phosphate isomerase